MPEVAVDRIQDAGLLAIADRREVPNTEHH
jgi:hypothetical protein